MDDQLDDEAFQVKTQALIKRAEELNLQWRVSQKIKNLPVLQHSENTERAYRTAINHFRDVCHYHLPATPHELAQYLVSCAETISPSTFTVRVSAISAWHRKIGFDDPTQNYEIRKLVKSLKMISSKAKKVTTPLKFEDFQKIIDHLEYTLDQLKKHPTRTQSQDSKLLRCYRDKSLILFGFWRGFLNHQLSGLVVEQLSIVPDQGMTILAHDPASQTLRDFFTPYLKHYCPVKALEDWLAIGKITDGPIFRGIDQWGKIDSVSLNSRSITLIVRGWLEEAGLTADYTGHSLRRGFASWAVEMGWDIKSILEYVGWAKLNQHHDALVQRTPSSQIFLAHDDDKLE
jgi:hypothetical protein